MIELLLCLFGLRHSDKIDSFIDHLIPDPTKDITPWSESQSKSFHSGFSEDYYSDIQNVMKSLKSK